MRKLFNRGEQKTMRQALRNHMPRPEQMLWFHLRNRNVGGFRFRRQHGIGPYIVDFYCPEARLAIELDGESHFERDANVHDVKRQRFIEVHGIHVLRFTNTNVRDRLEHVLSTITEVLRIPSHASLPPPLAPAPTPSRSPSGRGRIARAGGEPLGMGKNRSGFSLLELLVALGIIALVVVTVLGLLGRSIEVLRREEHRRVAIGIAEERLERFRNAPYDDLGTVGGIPTGAFVPRDTLERNGARYTVTTRIRFIDDPFDGVAPNDPIPNDMRELAVDVSWGANPNQTITLATLAAPPGLERAGTTGTLRLRVFDARGDPVEGASVQLSNSTVTPPIALTLPTDVSGEVTLPGAPASTAGYHIRVTRSGYNADATVAPSPEVPNPTSPPLTVIEHEVTTASFTIDRLATIAFTFRKYTPDQPFRDLATFTLQGQKTVGSRPNPTPPPDALPVYKAAPQSFTTNQGTLTIGNLEWDTYQFTEMMPDHDLAIADPLLPIELLPGTTKNVTIAFAPHHDHSLRVIVREASGTPVQDVTVQLTYTDPPQQTKTESTPSNGQVFFSPLRSGVATLTVTHANFETITRELTISGTMEVEVRLQRS